MNFQGALNNVVQGFKVRRKSWNNDEYMFYDKGELLMADKDGTFMLDLSSRDLLAIDWYCL